MLYQEKTFYSNINLTAKNSPCEVIQEDEVVVFCHTFIPVNLHIVIPPLWQITTEECFKGFLHGLRVVEFEEHNKVNVRAACRVQHTEVLAAYNRREARVSVDGCEFEQLFVGANKRAIVNNN
jgi:hypothetical protein